MGLTCKPGSSTSTTFQPPWSLLSICNSQPFCPRQPLVTRSRACAMKLRKAFTRGATCSSCGFGAFTPCYNVINVSQFMGYDMIVPNTLGSIIAEVLNTAQMSWTSDHGSFKNAYQVLPLQQRPRAACANLLFNATCAQTTQASFLTSWWGVLHSEHSCRKQSYGHHSPINKNSAVNMLFEQTKIWCVISPPWNHIIYIYVYL